VTTSSIYLFSNYDSRILRGSPGQAGLGKSRLFLLPLPGGRHWRLPGQVVLGRGSRSLLGARVGWLSRPRSGWHRLRACSSAVRTRSVALPRAGRPLAPALGRTSRRVFLLGYGRSSYDCSLSVSARPPHRPASRLGRSKTTKHCCANSCPMEHKRMWTF
jgi:hypothetical protein